MIDVPQDVAEVGDVTPRYFAAMQGFQIVRQVAGSLANDLEKSLEGGSNHQVGSQIIHLLAR